MKRIYVDVDDGVTFLDAKEMLAKMLLPCDDEFILAMGVMKLEEK